MCSKRSFFQIRGNPSLCVHYWVNFLYNKYYINRYEPIINPEIKMIHRTPYRILSAIQLVFLSYTQLSQISSREYLWLKRNFMLHIVRIIMMMFPFVMLNNTLNIKKGSQHKLWKVLCMFYLSTVTCLPQNQTKYVYHICY